MVQVAVRLSAISLRRVAEVLPTQYPLSQYEDPGKEYRQKLAEAVRCELDKAVPYFQWHGPRNCYARVQYLMALLEEAIRFLAVPTASLIEALKLDASAAHISQLVGEWIFDLRERPADVCGTWAAETLLPAWVSEKANSKSTDDRKRQNEQAGAVDEEDTKSNRPRTAAKPAMVCNESEICKSLLCRTHLIAEDEDVELAVSSDAESEDELPSPSTFFRRRPGLKASKTLSRVEVRVPKVADDDAAKSGRADPPMYISDTEADDQAPSPKPDSRKSDPKAFQQSCRGEALKEVNYNTKHHPQDEDLPTFRKRWRTTHPEDDDVRSLVKRRKITSSDVA